MADKIEMHRALEAAKIKVGGASALSRALRITPQAVNQWQVVPPERVLEVERHSGVSRHFLRPDIFGLSPHELPVSSSAGDVAGVPVTPPAQKGAPASFSNSPEVLQSGEAGVQRSAIDCTPATILMEAAR
jgi:DNA-binding transcriptional regulator YdaS (Cro superfamily)